MVHRRNATPTIGPWLDGVRQDVTRTFSVGIRLALGATRGQLLVLLIRETRLNRSGRALTWTCQRLKRMFV
jgi:hypothetical protein